jgi:hypothetical protein
MKVEIRYKSFLFIALIVVISSCIQEDITTIENSLFITPYYSIPIGKSSLTMEDVISAPSFDTIAADSSTTPDSTFTYNNKVYYLPPNATFDTTISEIYDFSGLQDWLEIATYVMFRLNIENNIPSEMICQVTFLDENQNSLFSLFNSPGLPVDAATNSTSYILSPYDTDPLTQNEILSLPEAHAIRVEITMLIQDNTTGVTYHSNQIFNLQIGIRIGFEKNLSE